MSGYVKEALHKFQHPTTSQPQNSLHQCNPPNYGTTAPQLAHQSPESTKIPPTESSTVQQVLGTFLYYARAVDPTILVALNIIAEEEAKITDATVKVVTQLIKYAAAHYESITRYHASGIILHIHSDAYFLSKPGAKSRAGGYHYLSIASAVPDKALLKQPPLNGTVNAKCTTMINVLASSIEAKLVNHMALIEMGHAQPPIVAVTDSATGDGFVNDNIRQQLSRYIYMQFNWVRDRVRRGEFLV